MLARSGIGRQLACTGNSKNYQCGRTRPRSDGLSGLARKADLVSGELFQLQPVRVAGVVSKPGRVLLFALDACSALVTTAALLASVD
jgi:hypothetical protein